MARSPSSSGGVVQEIPPTVAFTAAFAGLPDECYARLTFLEVPDIATWRRQSHRKTRHRRHASDRRYVTREHEACRRRCSRRYADAGDDVLVNGDGWTLVPTTNKPR